MRKGWSNYRQEKKLFPLIQDWRDKGTGMVLGRPKLNAIHSCDGVLTGNPEKRQGYTMRVTEGKCNRVVLVKNCAQLSKYSVPN